MSDSADDLFEKAERYLRSADALMQLRGFDSAASRLYYAMFYCAEALLGAKGFTYSSHGGLLSGFAQHFVKTGELPKEMHRWLVDAFDKRQAGDYEARSDLGLTDIEDVQAKAAKFVAAARALLDKLRGR